MNAKKILSVIVSGMLCALALSIPTFAEDTETDINDISAEITSADTEETKAETEAEAEEESEATEKAEVVEEPKNMEEDMHEATLSGDNEESIDNTNNESSRETQVSEKADTFKVSFTHTEETGKIEVYLEGYVKNPDDTYTSANIKEFVSAELHFTIADGDFGFKFEENGDWNYQWSDSKTCTISLKNNSTYQESNRISLGTLIVTGYGSCTLSVDRDTSKVFYGSNKENAIKISENSGIEFTNSAPTRNLDIRILFPNKVSFSNDTDYQDMTVTISGLYLSENIVVRLGKEVVFSSNVSGGDDYCTSSQFVCNIHLENELAEGGKYYITVSGGGYRTAHYSVTMNDNKEITFWNNVKEVPARIEESNATSAHKATFLAGDIVKDDKINIYDLSAVVSYFGCEINENNTEKYKKYDLNRDGCIDSRDVAYVLVSWGY